MTDWRQIQARIRKAKNSPDALTKLSELFQRTRDGMVAWEIGAIEEKSERIGEAVKWYGVAAERFRRAEWKKKAEEALVRLGVSVPADATAQSAGVHLASSDFQADPPPPDSLGDESENDSDAPSEDDTDTDAEPEDSQLAMMPQLVSAESRGQASGGTVPSPAAEESPAANDQQKRKRRRGRRGGRGRRRKDAASAPSLPNQAFAESVESQSQAQPQPAAARPKPDLPAPVSFRRPEAKAAPVEHSERAQASVPSEPARPAAVETAVPASQLPSQRSAHGRAGDPALASRMAHLESMLRRLLASTLHRLDDVEHAPAGPGVFLLSDSDQTTSYYIESCQTLRVGLGNVLRGGRSAKSNRGPSAGRGYSESGLKSKLAEHLGINEAKVNQYMKDHCVVRWIQLDDEAAHLAHFAIGVLRTPLNLD
jgi:hypothetical protein